VRAATQAFLDENELEIRPGAPRLMALADAWRAVPSDFGSTWSPRLTGLYESIAGARADAVAAAAALALHLNSLGWDEAWDVALPAECTFVFANHRLPAAMALAVVPASGSMTVCLRLGNGQRCEYQFRRRPDGWHCSALPRLRSVPTRQGVALSTEWPTPGNGGSTTVSAEVLALADDAITDRTASAFAMAIDLIASSAPMYLRWVVEVVREILVLRAQPERMRSGSKATWPGMIYMSVEDPLILAENLVHEASHQHFHVLQRFDSVEDGSDPTAYYSPAVNRHRPLGAVMLAYHAFANTLLFLRECDSLTLSAQAYRDARVAFLVPLVEELQVPLKFNRALTESGRGLITPLAARLDL
jgi:HEXXH motif-containing protein